MPIPCLGKWITDLTPLAKSPLGSNNSRVSIIERPEILCPKEFPPRIGQRLNKMISVDLFWFLFFQNISYFPELYNYFISTAKTHRSRNYKRRELWDWMRKCNGSRSEPLSSPSPAVTSTSSPARRIRKSTVIQLRESTNMTSVASKQSAPLSQPLRQDR